MDGNGVSIAEQWGPRQWPWENGSRDEVGGLSIARTLMQPDSQKKVKFFIHETDCPNLTEQVMDATYDDERPGKLMKRCVDHLLDCVRYFCLIARQPNPLLPQPNQDGKWLRDPRTLKVSLTQRNRSWLAPSSSERAKLFVPRQE